jgi:hypothetical protein
VNVCIEAADHQGLDVKTLMMAAKFTFEKFG